MPILGWPSPKQPSGNFCAIFDRWLFGADFANFSKEVLHRALFRVGHLLGAQRPLATSLLAWIAQAGHLEQGADPVTLILFCWHDGRHSAARGHQHDLAVALRLAAELGPRLHQSPSFLK